MIPDLKKSGIDKPTIYRNLPVGALYQYALCEVSLGGDVCPNAIASSGALISYSGQKTGRSPKDKRIVAEITSHDEVWWGSVNIALSEESFSLNLGIAKKFLNERPVLYVVDGYAGWSPQNRIKCRIICARPYHALFMHNMLIRPTERELADFGEPEWVIYNAGQCPADPNVEGVTSTTSVALNLKAHEMVILGSEYAGCMKKGIFTILNYLLPKQGVLSMHCSANEGIDGDTALFFGLSGTGKTTLSADPARKLIGDDEHGWDDYGIFNFEGGCYAKTVELSPEREPEIWNAIRYGTVLENVVYDPENMQVDFDDISITENTRASYPIEYIKNAKIPCMGRHPKNVIFLTCDAYGVLPPVSRLSPEQTMYHFISGYTAKVAGTEVGVKDPEATFSACFGAAFLVWHPMKYAELLKKRILMHNAKVWLVNTGWVGGGFGIGQRISLKNTRQIISAILDGGLDQVSYERDPIFGLEFPTSCGSLDHKVLNPKLSWSDASAYDRSAQKLAGLFQKNFSQYDADCSIEIKSAGPCVLVS
ncbi:MAG: phosphoenolpyruvate carboxykinase (ATP) [Candidatus Caenarcaniphilales bacterium]|nr:phosphoenolpyruvate carboxykinase (ATP) [Candidatus Caenarcaniphilales bacterium]